MRRTWLCVRGFGSGFKEVELCSGLDTVRENTGISVPGYPLIFYAEGKKEGVRLV